MLTLQTEEFFKSIKSGELAKVAQLVESDPSLLKATAKSGATGILSALYGGHQDVAKFLAAKKGSLDIYEASSLGDLEQVKQLVKRDPEKVKSYSAEGFPALGLAAFLGQGNVVKYLLDNGADVNAVAKNPTGYTALTGAVSTGRKEIAELLLKKGANVNHQYEEGFTALMEASASGNVEMTKLLLTHGANVNAKTKESKTALSYALEKGHQETLALLKAKGATQ